MAKKNEMTKENKDVTKKSSDVELSEDRPVFTPATDIYEEKDAIIVLSDMPGVSQEDLDITLEEDVLTITGKQCVCEPEKHELAHRGYYPGVFRRSFTILTEVDQDNITANIQNGVLRIKLPKSEKAKPRKINVQVT